MTSSFRNHKYCVVEVSGQIDVQVDSTGSLELYLLDENNSSELAPQKIAICDAGLIAFMRRKALLTENPQNQHPLNARITGTLAMDASKVQLLQISRALFIHQGAPLTYDVSG